jgi:hypothetical protein
MRKRAQGSLRYDAACDTTSVSTAVCAEIFASLGRASSAIERSIAINQDVVIKLSATGSSGSRQGASAYGDVDVLASAAVPVMLALPGSRDGSVLPQALAKQLANYGKDDLSAYDALITVNVPKDGFYFESGKSEEGSTLFNFGEFA